MRVLVVLNPRSGSLTKLGIDRGRERVAVLCAANGLAATIAVLRGSRIGDRIKKEIVSRERSAPCFDIVIVGGGDGSVGTAASVLAGSEIPLGILPLGTRNHFARDLRVPLDLEGAVLEPPADPKFGDATCNAPMRLAKQLQKPPRAIADELAADLRKAGLPHLAKVDVAGAGFVNLSAAPEFHQEEVKRILDEGADYGRSKMGAGCGASMTGSSLAMADGYG